MLLETVSTLCQNSYILLTMNKVIIITRDGEYSSNSNFASAIVNDCGCEVLPSNLLCNLFKQILKQVSDEKKDVSELRAFDISDEDIKDIISATRMLSLNDIDEDEIEEANQKLETVTAKLDYVDLWKRNNDKLKEIYKDKSGNDKPNLGEIYKTCNYEKEGQRYMIYFLLWNRLNIFETDVIVDKQSFIDAILKDCQINEDEKVFLFIHDKQWGITQDKILLRRGEDNLVESEYATTVYMLGEELANKLQYAACFKHVTGGTLFDKILTGDFDAPQSINIVVAEAEEKETFKELREVLYQKIESCN